MPNCITIFNHISLAYKFRSLQVCPQKGTNLRGETCKPYTFNLYLKMCTQWLRSLKQTTALFVQWDVRQTNQI